MQITFLGASHGVPEANRRCSCTLIETNGRYYFIDMGVNAIDALRTRGIEVEDVKGFVDNRARSYKCAGLWKVYSDEARARRLFTRFKRCTDTYCKLWQAGATIDQLAVAG